MIFSELIQATIKDAAQNLTGSPRRDFMAEVCEDYFEGSVRKIETYFGWNRAIVQFGLHESRTVILCTTDNYRSVLPP
jgi:hypothetical protein